MKNSVVQKNPNVPLDAPTKKGVDAGNSDGTKVSFGRPCPYRDFRLPPLSYNVKGTMLKLKELFPGPADAALAATSGGRSLTPRGSGPAPQLKMSGSG